MIFDLERFKIQKTGLIPVRLWNDMIDVLASALITSFVGGAVVRTIHGTSLYCKTDSGTPNDPFSCLLNIGAGSGGALDYSVSVNQDSHCWVLDGRGWRDIPITGLFNPDTTSAGYPVTHALVTGEDPGVIDDYVLLEIAFDASGYATSASIVTKGDGSSADPTLPAWDSSGNALFACNSATPALQTVARIVIAQWQGKKLTQVIKQNLGLYDMVVDGQLASYPRPLY